ncbi:hypothetical protein LEP1GSC163_2538 [Leptospira santarosai str. CBC379]|nr:hypothetical protein [Leptospira santarosai]EKR93806.1 hypothetical protein LEP1GSC163_2538 [Leptospira santarosai str. CBC379]
MPSLKEELNIYLLEKHQAWHEARGMLSPSKILNANQLTANHLQSFGLQAGTSALSYNAGLSYSERDGISGSAGIGLGLGKNAATGSYSSTLNLGVSYNRRDGFGTSVGISRNNNVVMPGVGASISSAESAPKVVSRLRKTGPLLKNVK